MDTQLRRRKDCSFRACRWRGHVGEKELIKYTSAGHSSSAIQEHLALHSTKMMAISLPMKKGKLIADVQYWEDRLPLWLFA
jgi:hypothetical protein